MKEGLKHTQITLQLLLIGAMQSTSYLATQGFFKELIIFKQYYIVFISLFAIATGFLAVATVFNMNVLQAEYVGDFSLESITIMAEAQNENNNNNYTKGPRLTNWKCYLITCTYETEINTASNSGASYNSSLGATVPIPNSPISVSGSSQISANYQSQTNQRTVISRVTITKVACGSGAGFCADSAPDGNPCS